MSAAGPTHGRSCERGEAQARSARPRAWMAADATLSRFARCRNEAAARPPVGGDREAISGGNLL
jgi:hypothetical protein